jgi:hypothetical protein
MDLNFLKKTEYNNGEIISDLIKYLNGKYNFNNILFLRTPTTGMWLDNLFTDNKAIIRILYDTNILKNYKCHVSTIKINYRDLNKIISSFNKKFDLICIDSFHLYSNSINDINITSSYLTQNGFIICHDCFPSEKIFASPTYKKENWCGETYIAFIDFAYNNPEYFYGLINIDTGIGIISKIELKPLKNNFNKEKQKNLLLNTIDKYDYFIKNYNDIMNVITL